MSITGQRLKERRKAIEKSADDVAYELGVSRSTIFRYENGFIEKVPANVIQELANILNTTPAYLMGWTDDPHDWEQIGNDNGIYPPRDYEGSYEDYVKYKMREEQDHLIDEYYDTHPDEDINAPLSPEFPSHIRAAARGMMELSPEDQKMAMDMIKFLSQKGKEAKEE